MPSRYAYDIEYLKIILVLDLFCSMKFKDFRAFSRFLVGIEIKKYDDSKTLREVSVLVCLITSVRAGNDRIFNFFRFKEITVL